MKWFRLDSVAPDAAARFRQASSARRRQAARLACERAIERVGVTEPEVIEALEVLRSLGPADATLRERLESLVARYDDEYFALDEEVGEKQRALACFSKARAVSSLVFALCQDDEELHEAIYESLAAIDESAELVGLVERALG